VVARASTHKLKSTSKIDLTVPYGSVDGSAWRGVKTLWKLNLRQQKIPTKEKGGICTERERRVYGDETQTEFELVIMPSSPLSSSHKGHDDV